MTVEQILGLDVSNEPHRERCGGTITSDTLSVWWQERAAHLLDGVQQPPVAVHHDRDGQDEAEYKQADDVGVRLRRALGPRHRAARPCPLQSITTPAQQGGHCPEQGVQPGPANRQERLAVVGGPLVVDDLLLFVTLISSKRHFNGQADLCDRCHQTKYQPSPASVQTVAGEESGAEQDMGSAHRRFIERRAKGPVLHRERRAFSPMKAQQVRTPLKSARDQEREGEREIKTRQCRLHGNH
ncbi:hypothetical protein JZ751_010795 [Albula glossodonta]|uniref:Uncharacterized protein n=1 Tax=Albula glossodonta TaxID=121402 RepID=A0A8T2N7E3_9TELE|nr:hypothetical protein JZ751_010795 [Albula glossodonta]